MEIEPDNSDWIEMKLFFYHKLDKQVQAPLLSRLRVKKLLAKAKEGDVGADDADGANDNEKIQFLWWPL